MEKCFICGGNFDFFMYGYDFLYTETHKRFSIVKCKICGVEKISPMPTSEELKKYYPQTYYMSEISSKSNDSFAAKLYSKIISRLIFVRLYNKPSVLRFLFRNFILQIPDIKNKGNKKNYLDIGCNNAKYFPSLKKAGWNCYGFELGDSHLSGDIFYDSSLDNISFGDKKFDYIIMNQVIEHVINPIDYLKKIKDILADDGECVITFPNNDGISAKLFKEYWFNRDIPRHVINYNTKNFSMLLNKMGFHIKQVKYMGFGGFVYSLQNLLKRKYHRHWNRLFGTFFILPFFLIDFLFIIIRKNDCVKFVIRK